MAITHGSYRKMIRETIHESQKCQRNWDLSKSIPEEDKQLLIESATNCPSKQNLNYYRLHVIEDRDMIEEIHKKTVGFGPIYSDYDSELRKENSFDEKTTEEGKYYTNPQVLGQLLLVFTENENPLLKRQDTYVPNVQYDDEWAEDRSIAIGIAAGYVNIVATQLGYATGCCKCMDSSAIADILGEVPVLLMGVGCADLSKDRRQHHYENFKFPTLKKMKNIEVITHS
jgi:nitroreductase